MLSLLPRHRIFRQSAWIALFALILQVFLPLLHTPANAASLGHKDPASIPVMLHCSMASAPTAGSPDNPVKKPPICPVCQAMHLLSGAYTPPEAAAVLHVYPRGRFHLLSLEREIPRQIWISPEARPRAPPDLA